MTNLEPPVDPANPSDTDWATCEFCGAPTNVVHLETIKDTVLCLWCRGTQTSESLDEGTGCVVTFTSDGAGWSSSCGVTHTVPENTPGRVLDAIPSLPTATAYRHLIPV